LPKGELAEDEVEIIRDGECTRPLGLKNTDNKVIVSATISTFRKDMRRSTHASQRGFVPGRLLVQNVLDLDAAARIQGMKAAIRHGGKSDRLAALALWDYAAAFPSMSHNWILHVLAQRKFPIGFQNFVRLILFFATASADIDGAFLPLFLYLSGVIQGCPASAFLFDVCIDPFLAALQHHIADRGRGIIRACADDIGAALADFRFLKYCYPVFVEAEKCAGLSLKPVKCVIVPTSHTLDVHIALRIKTWLQENIPDWINFNIKSAAIYLGFLLGPTAGSTQWDKLMRKYLARARAIGATHAPFNISAYMYNSKAVSVLAYKAQLIPPPARTQQSERGALSTITHFATNSLTVKEFFNMQTLGCTKIQSIDCLAAASMLRFALSSHRSWVEWVRQLRVVAREALPLRHVFSGILSPDFWDSRPIALNLETAWQEAARHKWFTDLALGNENGHSCSGGLKGPDTKRCPPNIQRTFYSNILAI
jgi:hypothetical protein